MSTYFDKFPKVKYNNKIVRDITKRTKFVDDLRSNPYVFLPYTVEEGEKPEDVAFYYYGSVEYTWIINMANNIIDPYYDWIMSEKNFQNYLIKKYSEQANTTGYDVIAWTQNELIDSNIVHYRKVSDNSVQINKDTYALSANLIPEFEASDWEAVRIFDYENELNENKRVIQVIDKDYIRKMESLLETLLNE